MMWSDLPTEITSTILLELPVKTLIVCSSLSKSFFSLITSHEFINTHIAENHPTTHFFLRYLTNARRALDYEPDYKSEVCKEIYHLEPDNDNFTSFLTQGLRVPFHSSPGDWFHVAGCVNGVLCLVNDWTDETTLIILWNPSIRKYVHVPKPHGQYQSVWGFGFDYVSNDYKVVRMVYLDSETYSKETKVEIYSLQSRCWRNVGNGPKYRIERGFDPDGYIPCFLHGAVHWVGSNTEFVKRGLLRIPIKNENAIIKFDVVKENFEIIEVPSLLKESISYNHTIDFYVQDCKGMLALIRQYSFTSCSVWVMKEYGVVSSWTKILGFKYGGSSNCCHMPMAFCFRNNGNVVMVKCGDDDGRKELIVSYNLVTRDKKILGVLAAEYVESNSFYLSTYVESMALINEGKGIDKHTKLKLYPFPGEWEVLWP